MSSGQTSGNNKTWLARHLKTLFHTITPQSTGRMATAMRTTTRITVTITTATIITIITTPTPRNRRRPHVAAAGARPPSR